MIPPRPRLALLTVLLAAIATSACGQAPASTEAFRGWPELPAHLAVPTETPRLLPGGAIGRGALIYRPRGTLELRLVTEDGRQFTLPDPPLGEGRQGTLWATLSPDGRWLGLRTAEYVQDPRYRVRDLLTDAALVVEGTPVAWSPNARYLLLRQLDDDLVVLEPATGQSASVDVASDARHLVVGVAPTGAPVSYGPTADALRIQIGTHEPVTLTFAPSADHECWCPLGPMRLSPDGRRFAIQLHHRGGLSAETGAKVPDSELPDKVAVYDAATGAELSRFSWGGELVADTGAGLLIRESVPGGEVLALFSPDTGDGRQLSGLPPVAQAIVPGEIFYDGE